MHALVTERVFQGHLCKSESLLLSKAVSLGRNGYHDFIKNAISILRRSKEISGYKKPVRVKFISTNAPRSKSVFLDSNGNIVVMIDAGLILADNEELTTLFIHELYHKKYRKQFFETMERVLRKVTGAPYMNPKVDPVAFSYAHYYAEYYVVDRRVYEAFRQGAKKVQLKSCSPPKNQLKSLDIFLRSLVAITIIQDLEAIPLLQEIARDWRSGTISKLHVQKIKKCLQKELVQFSAEHVV